jgi:cystathionine gamma-synthase
VNAQALAAALEQKPKLVLIETPSNPLLRVVPHICSAAKAAGALTVVDNTFFSPALQQPTEAGRGFGVAFLHKIS